MRCQIVLRKEKCRLDRVVRSVNSEVYYIIQNEHPKSNGSHIQDNIDYIWKITVDGATGNCGGVVGIVLSNNVDEVVASWSLQLASSKPVTIETVAGIRAANLLQKPVLVASDYKVSVDASLLRQPPPWHCATLVEKCRLMVKPHIHLMNIRRDDNEVAHHTARLAMHTSHHQTLSDSLFCSLLCFYCFSEGGVVLGSKVVRIAALLPIIWLHKVVLLLRCEESAGPPFRADDKDGLQNYVLHLDGEDDLIKLITRMKRKDTDRWMEKGNRRKPPALVNIIMNHSSLRQGFKNVGAFDNEAVLPLVREEPPNCWALPVVTLAAIATVLPGVDKHEVKLLLRAVHEGLRFVRLVEKHWDEVGLVKMRDAADIVWLRIDLYKKWFDFDLRFSVPQDNTLTNGKERIEKMGSVAKDCVQQFSSQPEAEKNNLAWPEKVLAANCMYRVCATVLRDFYNDTMVHQTDSDLFAWLQGIVSDILGACFTNLLQAIRLECFSSRIMERERRVRDAALSLGAMWDILEALEVAREAQLFPPEFQYIDDWRKKEPMNPSNDQTHTLSPSMFQVPTTPTASLQMGNRIY